MHRKGHWLVACCLFIVAGCNANSQFPVTGKVSFKDGRDIKVLAGGLVTLESANEIATATSRGTIRADGTFTVGTVAENDGALPGKYIVLVEPPVPARPVDRPKNWPPLKEKYMRGDKTPLRFEVEKKSNVLNIEVE